MVRIRHKIRLLYLLSILAGLAVLLFIVVNQNSSIIRQAFYEYSLETTRRLPGSYLSKRKPNASYCDFKYGLPEELLYEEGDLKYGPEEGERSPYRILYNIIEGKGTAETPDVTYVTHITVDFVNYVAEIVRFWEGPISIAAFVPDFDADLALRQMLQFCQCIPEMSRVSLHFVFPAQEPPYLQNHPQEDASCDIADSSKFVTYRSYNELKYPINVCRNVAREAATTYFVMVSDIQLIPSNRLASKFSDMIKTFPNLKINSPSRVFVVPVFEVGLHDVIPRSKKYLLTMVREERAVYFHRHICSHCQKFPSITTWLESSTDDVKPFLVAKREHPFHRWEPIYIGSKNEPLYSEALSWEGLQDKMTQMLEMCLIGYKFIVLDGAFLVHWPGIRKTKYKTTLTNYWRTPYRKENSLHYEKIVKKLAQKYDDNPKCKLL